MCKENVLPTELLLWPQGSHFLNDEIFFFTKIVSRLLRIQYWYVKLCVNIIVELKCPLCPKHFIKSDDNSNNKRFLVSLPLAYASSGNHISLIFQMKLKPSLDRAKRSILLYITSIFCPYGQCFSYFSRYTR